MALANDDQTFEPPVQQEVNRTLINICWELPIDFVSCCWGDYNVAGNDQSVPRWRRDGRVRRLAALQRLQKVELRGEMRFSAKTKHWSVRWFIPRKENVLLLTGPYCGYFQVEYTIFGGLLPTINKFELVWAGEALRKKSFSPTAWRGCSGTLFPPPLLAPYMALSWLCHDTAQSFVIELK